MRMQLKCGAGHHEVIGEHERAHRAGEIGMAELSDHAVCAYGVWLAYNWRNHGDKWCHGGHGTSDKKFRARIADLVVCHATDQFFGAT
jgi:hypothetical protein